MDKSPDAFRTISEVSELLDLPQHVLRFWETRFSQIKPMKRAGGRRYYRPSDIELLKGIKHLLYDQGYTIKGVLKVLKDNSTAFVVAIGSDDMATAEALTAKKQKKNEKSTKEQASTEQPNDDFFSLLKINDDPELGRPIDRMSKNDKTLLQEALFELIECKRILDRTR